MAYYIHNGHTEFILCLGHKVQAFHTYFKQLGAIPIPSINGDSKSHRFRLMNDEGVIIDVSLVDTGLSSSIGQRLRKVHPFLVGEQVFLANYADGLSDVPLDKVLQVLDDRPGMIGVMVAVQPTQSFHYVHYEHDGVVTGIKPGAAVDMRINGGYFAFRAEIFDYIGEDDDLLEGTFDRLTATRRLLAYTHDGFWRACDTFKDLLALEAMRASGPAPWEIWQTAPENIRVAS